MNFQKELERIGTDLFTDAFLERVTDAARCHLEECFSVSEEELLTGMEELRNMCDAHQHEVLEKSKTFIGNSRKVR